MILYEAHTLDINNPFSIREVKKLTWELHFHRAYECIYVLEGEINCKVEHREYIARAGEIVFVMPNQLHSIATGYYSHVVVLLFSPELIGHFHNTYLDMVPEKCCFPFLASTQADNFSSHKEIKPQNIYALKALLYHICGELIEQTNFVPRINSSGDLLIYNLLAFIDKHYTGECSLKTAAEECCCDYYHASKTFIKYTGISFVNYVNNLRIHKACYLIKHSNDSYLNVALNCGFASLRNFNRNFLKFCGCTPSEYRRRISAT